MAPVTFAPAGAMTPSAEFLFFIFSGEIFSIFEEACFRNVTRSVWTDRFKQNVQTCNDLRFCDN